MTVTMNQRLGLLPIELKLPSSGLLFFDDEFFKQKRGLRDMLSRDGPLTQIRILVSKRQDAARLASDNGVAICRRKDEAA